MRSPHPGYAGAARTRGPPANICGVQCDRALADGLITNLVTLWRARSKVAAGLGIVFRLAVFTFEPSFPCESMAVVAHGHPSKTAEGSAGVYQDYTFYEPRQTQLISRVPGAAFTVDPVRCARVVWCRGPVVPGALLYILILQRTGPASRCRRPFFRVHHLRQFQVRQPRTCACPCPYQRTTTEPPNANHIPASLFWFSTYIYVHVHVHVSWLLLSCGCYNSPSKPAPDLVTSTTTAIHTQASAPVPFSSGMRMQLMISARAIAK